MTTSISEYYRQHDERRRLLQQILQLLDQVAALEPHVDYWGVRRMLQQRLELAEYTGD